MTELELTSEPSGFGANLNQAWKAIVSSFGIPAVSVGLTLLSSAVGLLMQREPDLSIFLIWAPFSLFYLGWVGVERIFFLRRFRNETLSVSEGFRLFPRFIVRHLLLLVLIFLPFLLLMSVQFLSYRSRSMWGAVIGGSMLGGVAYAILTLVMWVAVDAAATFITPALAFSTRRVTEGIRVGLRFLVGNWPASAPYVVLPVLVLFVFTIGASTQFLPWPAQLVVSAVSTLAALTFKGATARFYLANLAHEVGPDGAAREDAIETAPELYGRPDGRPTRFVSRVGLATAVIGVGILLLWPVSINFESRTPNSSFSGGVNCGGPLRVMLLGPRSTEPPMMQLMDGSTSLENYERVKQQCRGAATLPLTGGTFVALTGAMLWANGRRSKPTEVSP